jgi:glycosyltransferase involved in cell wall biosynthesis
MPTTLLGKAREKGLRESLELSREIVHARIAARDRTGRAFVFISPPMNLSGAPLVLAQAVEEFADKYGAESLRVLSPQIHPELRERIERKGVKVERAAAVMSSALVRFQLALRFDDFVLLNTVVVPSNYRMYVLKALKFERLSQANWYIHEDAEQLPVAAPFLLEPNTQRVIKELVKTNKLRILVPSQYIKVQYDKLFDTDKTRILPYLTDNNQRFEDRDNSEYSSIQFLLCGRPTDGRKGHMIALAAFQDFVTRYYRENPTHYRDFSLTLVGMTNDHIAAQIVSVGRSILGDSLRVVGETSHEEHLAITRECNAVICCSFNEALPLFVMEAMSVGHIVIRNDCGGLEEQLQDGVNGFRIDSSDVAEFSRVLESLLNKASMTDRQLHAMGRASQHMLRSLHRAHATAIECLQRPAA